MKELLALRPKTYSYLKDNGCVDKKAKGRKLRKRCTMYSGKTLTRLSLVKMMSDERVQMFELS